jgi:hypothetical protein
MKYTPIEPSELLYNKMTLDEYKALKLKTLRELVNGNEITKWLKILRDEFYELLFNDNEETK